LDQHENEEDATNAEQALAPTNAEHEGDVNEEEEEEEEEEEKENVEQALADTLSTSQVRRGRGPNKLPSACFVITTVNEVGDPTQPSILVNAWKILIGKLVRENVPVTYRFWKDKTHEEKYIVLNSIK
jgi:hypothetical protein